MFTETLNFLSVLFPSSLHYWPLMVKNFYSWVQLALGKKAICYVSWRRGKILNKKSDISTQRTFIYRTGSTKIFLLTLTDSHNAKSLPRQSNSLEVMKLYCRESVTMHRLAWAPVCQWDRGSSWEKPYLSKLEVHRASLFPSLWWSSCWNNLYLT